MAKDKKHVPVNFTKKTSLNCIFLWVVFLKDAVPSAELLRGWSPDSRGTDHCSWPGVTCDVKSRVVALVVPSSSPRSRPGRGIAGELPPSVGLLTELKEPVSSPAGT
jgi:hypothetical protein